MIVYTVIKEANNPRYAGTVTVNPLNFAFSALAGPVFGWIMQSAYTGTRTPEHYQVTFQPLLYGLALAIALTFLLKEKGPAVPLPVEALETV